MAEMAALWMGGGECYAARNGEMGLRQVKGVWQNWRNEGRKQI